MNADQLLERIFSLSRRAPAAKAPGMAFGLETTVLAHWREAVENRSGNAGLVRGLRWAALTACAVALLAGVSESDQLDAFNSRYDPGARLADSAIVAGYGYE